MSLKTDIIKTLKENRPNLSESSIRTYLTTLINIPSKLNTDIKNIKLKWYDDNVDNILKYYKDTEPRFRKTKLSALFVLTKNPKYQVLMKKDIIFDQQLNHYYRGVYNSVPYTEYFYLHGSLEPHIIQHEAITPVVNKKQLFLNKIDELKDKYNFQDNDYIEIVNFLK